MGVFALLFAAWSAFAFAAKNDHPSRPAYYASPCARLLAAQLANAPQSSVVRYGAGGAAWLDPYSWLEDMESPATQEWIARQNALTAHTIAATPERDAIHRRVTELHVGGATPAFYRSGLRFRYRRDRDQNQNVLYIGEGEDGWRALIDPNAIDAAGTTTIGNLSVSPNGEYIAYALQRNGLDQEEWRIRNIRTGEDLPDVLRAKFSSVSWLPDSSAFFYSRYPHQDGGHFNLPDINNKVYFHRLRTAQSEDLLTYERPDHPRWGMSPYVSGDGRWLIITVSEGTERKNTVFVRSRENPASAFVAIPGDEALNYELRLVLVDGDTAYFRTTKDAPRGKLIAMDLRNPDIAAARTVIDELPWPGAPLDSLMAVKDGFVATTLIDAVSRFLVFDRNGRLVRQITPTVPGTIANLSYDRANNVMYSTFESFTLPRSIYSLNLSDRMSRPVEVSGNELPFNPREYEITQVRYPSRDGTQVPMFLIRKKNVAPNGAVPTLLYGYGGFNIPLTPTYSSANMAWLEMGGLLAIPSLRGGGEYGEAWHEAGMRGRKQNVFDDFIGAAEWLIESGWTNRNRMAASGGSNGGLLVGAAITQRPDLFGAALPAVGVLDMLRYQEFSAGKHWMGEYGASTETERELHWLRRYSPLHNVSEGMNYPATLIMTGDHDDRVVPLHSYKFAAALQRAQGGQQPILLRVDVNAGHGAGKPLSAWLNEQADKLAFLFEMLGMRGMQRP